jgi:threonine aldolase
VIFELVEDIEADTLVTYLKEKNILCHPFGENTVRFVLHLDIKEEMLELVRLALTEFGDEVSSR